MLQRHLAAHRGGQGTRRGRIGHARRRLEQLEHPASRPHRLLVAREQARERGDRRGDEHGVQQEGHERPRRHDPREHQPSTLPQHRHRAAEGHERDHREEGAADHGAADRDAHDLGHALPVARGLPGFLHKALHDPDLAERLLGHRRRVGHLVLHLGARAP